MFKAGLLCLFVALALGGCGQHVEPSTTYLTPPPPPPLRPLGADPGQPPYDLPIAPAGWLIGAGLKLGEPFPVAKPGEPAGPGFVIKGEMRVLLELAIGDTKARSDQIIDAIEKMPRPIAIRVYDLITTESAPPASPTVIIVCPSLTVLGSDGLCH
jgi:hypothetical protein